MDEPTIEDLIKALPPKEKTRVLGLKKLLDQREAIDDEQEKKIQQIKIKYNAKIQPLLQRASQIIQGGAIKRDEVSNAKENIKGGEDVESFLKGKVISGYWNGVFSNSGLVDEISDSDEKALGFLIDIQKLPNKEDDLQSIELNFIFKTNPFFQETSIKRKLVIRAGQALCVEGEKMTWREGQCLTHEIKKATNKKTGQKSTIQGSKIQSFFDIFLDWDRQNVEELSRASGMISELSEMVLLDSIDYFLGVINADEESDDDDDLDEEDEEEKD